MCQKYILEPCERAHHNGFKEEEHRLVLWGAHDKYRGDATWSINTRTNADGEKRSQVVVTDNHNIEKAILYIQHTDRCRSVPSLTCKVREMLGNPIIPESLVRCRYKGMIRHGYLTFAGEIKPKGYELFMMLRSYSYMRGLPTKLRESIKELGSDLVRSCDT